MIFKKKSLETTRIETYKTLYDITQAIEKVYDKATNDKYKQYLYELKEKTKFTINNNKHLALKDFKKFVALLNDVYKMLNHEVWHSGKIKRKLKQLENILQLIL